MDNNGRGDGSEGDRREERGQRPGKAFLEGEHKVVDGADPSNSEPGEAAEFDAAETRGSKYR